jgi:hypothetical protein
MNTSSGRHEVVKVKGPCQPRSSLYDCGCDLVPQAVDRGGLCHQQPVQPRPRSLGGEALWTTTSATEWLAGFSLCSGPSWGPSEPLRGALAHGQNGAILAACLISRNRVAAAERRDSRCADCLETFYIDRLQTISAARIAPFCRRSSISGDKRRCDKLHTCCKQAANMLRTGCGDEPGKL